MLTGVAMQESIRFASAGDDDVKIWDSSSITLVEQFSPHTASHPVSSVCWGSNSILAISCDSLFVWLFSSTR